MSSCLKGPLHCLAHVESENSDVVESHGSVKMILPWESPWTWQLYCTSYAQSFALATQAVLHSRYSIGEPRMAWRKLDSYLPFLAPKQGLEWVATPRSTVCQALDVIHVLLEINICCQLRRDYIRSACVVDTSHSPRPRASEDEYGF